MVDKKLTEWERKTKQLKSDIKKLSAYPNAPMPTASYINVPGGDPRINTGAPEKGGSLTPDPSQPNYQAALFQSPISPPITTAPMPYLPTRSGVPSYNFLSLTAKTMRYSRTGTLNYGGYFKVEYLPELQGREAAVIYNMMRRGDYQVAAVTRHIENAMKSARYKYLSVEPGNEEEDLIAEYVNWGIFEQLGSSLGQTWPDNLQNLLSFLQYGYCLCEPFWESTQHKKYGDCWVIKSLGYVDQMSVWRWKILADRIWSVQQIAWGDDYVMTEIPGDEIMILCNEKLGNNYEGISIYRSAYGPWFRKNLYHTIDGIGIERAALGVPVVTTDTDLTGTQQDENLETMMTNFMLGNTNYLKFVKGIACTLEKVPYDSKTVQEAIKMCDIAIAKSVMVEFIELGATVQSGSRALAQPKLEDFKNSLKYIGQIIDYALRPWIKLLVIKKFGEREKYPTLQISGIDEIGLELSETMKNYMDAGAITPDDTLENHLREINNLPKIDETTRRIPPVKGQGAPESKISPSGLLREHKHGKRLKENKKKSRALKKVDFKQIKSDFDAANAELIDLAKKWNQKALDKFKVDLTNRLQHAKTEKEKLTAMAGIQIGYSGQYADELENYLKKTVIIGRGQANSEMRTAKKLKEYPYVNDLPAGIMGWVKINSKIISSTQLQSLFKNVSIAAIKSYDNSKSNEQIVNDSVSAGQEFVDNENLLGTGIIANKSINEGRWSLFHEHSEELAGFEWSATLENSCDYCAEMDGLTMSIDDADSYEYAPPVHPQCECVLVPILKDEWNDDEDEWDGLDEIENKFTKDEIEKYKVLSEYIGITKNKPREREKAGVV